MGEDGLDREVYEGIGAAVRDWRARRLTWAELLDRIEQAATRLSAAGLSQGGELSWRLDRLRGLGAPAADGHAPPAPTRLLERELKQVMNVGPDWKPPPPRPRSAQWLTFAGLLAAYGGVDVFFGKTSLAILAFAFAAVFAGLAYQARMQERRGSGRGRSKHDRAKHDQAKHDQAKHGQARPGQSVPAEPATSDSEVPAPATSDPGAVRLRTTDPAAARPTTPDTVVRTREADRRA